jgi:hypothetical protein
MRLAKIDYHFFDDLDFFLALKVDESHDGITRRVEDALYLIPRQAEQEFLKIVICTSLDLEVFHGWIPIFLPATSESLDGLFKGHSTATLLGYILQAIGRRNPTYYGKKETGSIMLLSSSSVCTETVKLTLLCELGRMPSRQTLVVSYLSIGVLSYRKVKT